MVGTILVITLRNMTCYNFKHSSDTQYKDKDHKCPRVKKIDNTS